jgi:uncharacterized protein YbjQ (UPF0145 family)
MEIIITTTNFIEGYKIVRYLSPIVTNIVIGTSFLTDLFAGIRDIVGGRSNAYQQELNEMYNEAVKQLKIEAEKIGANCVLGVKFDLDEISGKGMQMFMLNAVGTPVVIKTEEEYLQIKNNQRIEKEKRIIKEKEQRQRIKSIEDLIKDEEILKRAQDIRRIYGKAVYIDFLKNKAKEFGIENCDIPEEIL